MWKKGQSGNPKGRPKDGESWSGIIREMSEMSADQIAKMVGVDNELGRAFKTLPQNVAMKKLIVARVFTSLMFEPTAQVWNNLMDRAEGKVADRLEHSGPDGNSIPVEIFDSAVKRVYKK